MVQEELLGDMSDYRNSRKGWNKKKEANENKMLQLICLINVE